jgi:hypothetical protein
MAKRFALFATFLVVASFRVLNLAFPIADYFKDWPNYF